MINIQQILELEEGKRLWVICPEETSKFLELNNIKKASYENLFMSYINRSIDKANDVNLDVFLNKYSQLFIDEHERIMNDIDIVIGKNAINRLRDNNISWVFRNNRYIFSKSPFKS